MSSALASARKRSLPQPSPQPPNNNNNNKVASSSQQQQVSQNSMTLPQIIDVYGRRLLVLEQQQSLFQREQQSSERREQQSLFQREQQSSERREQQSDPQQLVQQAFAPHLDEINARYDLLAQEIHSLKDIVLHLQDYTMSVNQRLLEGAFSPQQQEQQSQQSQQQQEQQQQSQQQQSSLDAEAASLQEDIAYLQAQLDNVPEEYELNPGI